MAAVADCFVLTFRAIAQGSKLQWSNACCDATGTLDRVELKPQFTTLKPHITMRAGGDTSKDRYSAFWRGQKRTALSPSLRSGVSMTTGIKLG